MSKPIEIYQVQQVTENSVEALQQLVKELNKQLLEISQRLMPVPRIHWRTDLDTYDFVLADFTTDGNWRELDLSDILPSNAQAIVIYCHVQDNAAGNSIEFRSFYDTTDIISVEATTNVANQPLDTEGMIDVSERKVIKYKGTNTTFSAINFAIRGYWYW